MLKLPEEFPPKPWVILVVGINGVGKATTISGLRMSLGSKENRLCWVLQTHSGRSHRTARIWAKRTDSEFVAQQGADAASFTFDAIEAAKARIYVISWTLPEDCTRST